MITLVLDCGTRVHINLPILSFKQRWEEGSSDYLMIFADIEGNNILVNRGAVNLVIEDNHDR